MRERSVLTCFTRKKSSAPLPGEGYFKEVSRMSMESAIAFYERLEKDEE